MINQQDSAYVSQTPASPQTEYSAPAVAPPVGLVTTLTAGLLAYGSPPAPCLPGCPVASIGADYPPTVAEAATVLVFELREVAFFKTSPCSLLSPNIRNRRTGQYHSLIIVANSGIADAVWSPTMHGDAPLRSTHPTNTANGSSYREEETELSDILK